MIANKVKPKIQKVIDKFPTYVDIYRGVKNEFGELDGKDLICSVKGFYHEGNTQITPTITDKGQVKRSNQIFLMVVYDDTTSNIKENDYFFLENVKYIIKDLGNQNRLNIYLDMLVERC